MEIETFITILLVAMAQLLLFVDSWRRARHADDEALVDFREWSSLDIVERASRGMAPDWLHYEENLGRIFQACDERLRINAAAALATGLGGTIFALIVSLAFNRPEDLDAMEPLRMVWGMGSALSGSLFGVLNNLLIVLILLPWAERNFMKRSHKLRQLLRQIEQENRPQALFTEALKGELGSLRESIQSEFAKAFSDAVADFPRVVKEFAGQAENLATVVANQGQSVGSAVGALKEHAKLVANGSAQMLPFAQQLAASTSSLVQLPSHLQEALREGSRAWQQSVRQEHQERIQQLIFLQNQVEQNSQKREKEMLAATDQLRVAVDRVRHEVGKIPGQLVKEIKMVLDEQFKATREMQTAVTEVRDEIEKLPQQLQAVTAENVDTFGIKFGREAREVVSDLITRIGDENRELRRHIAENEKRLKSETGTVVRELLEQTAGKVNDQISEPLRQVVQKIEETTQLLPKAASRLEEAQKEWVESQQETLKGWSEAAKQTGHAAQSLVNANGQLKIGAESLTLTSENFGRIANLTADFEKTLQRSLREVTSQHLADMEPIRDQMMSIMASLGSTHESIDQSVERQVDFIESCIVALMKGRGKVTLERPR